MRPETLKLQEKTLQAIGTGNEFLNRTPMILKVIGGINKWDCTKLKCFCIIKKTISTVKRQPTE